jgi:uncharacterized protein Yka (UPF0111/DUF47 family)
LKVFKSLLVVGEGKIFGELSQIIAIAEEANTILIDMVGNCNRDALHEALEAVHVLEKKADSIAFKISEDITAGAVSPNILNSLLECVRTANDITDTYYYNGRELSRMAQARFPYSEALEESEWTARFKSMLQMADRALGKVKQILLSSDLSEISRLRKEIKALEHEADEVKDKGFDSLYRQAMSMHYLQFHHYTELLHKFDDILDFSEDLSDLVLSIINSIVK